MSSTTPYTPAVIGIHLGTTTSYGCFLTADEKKEFIIDNHGNQMTPWMVLGKLKVTAEAKLGGTKVINAVITVPDHFDNAQREAIKDAATSAGFYGMVHIISEHVAILNAYSFIKTCRRTTKKNVLVFHQGKNTLNVVVFELMNGILQKTSSSRTNLGGEDFDLRLTKYFLEMLKHHQSKEVLEKEHSIYQLKTACEQAKKMLSFTTETCIEVKELNFSASLTFGKFFKLCLRLFFSAMIHVKNFLRDEKIDQSQIDEIVLVGGHTRIPMVQVLLKADFNEGTKLNIKINPKKIFAYGAAVHASHVICNARSFPRMKTNVRLNNATPFLLRISSLFGVMEEMIEPCAALPFKKKMTCFTTWKNDQTSALFEVYAGKQAEMEGNNNPIGVFKIPSHHSSVFGTVTQCDFTFAIAEIDFTLVVTAQVKGISEKSCITIPKDFWWTPSNETALVKRLKVEPLEAKQKQLEDDNRRQQFSNRVLELLPTINMTLAPHNGLEAAEQRPATEMIDNIMDWLNEADDEPVEKVEEKLAEMEAICSPLLAKLAQKKND